MRLASTVRAVALFEAAKGALVLLAGLGALSLIHHDAQRLAVAAGWPSTPQPGQALPAYLYRCRCTPHGCSFVAIRYPGRGVCIGSSGRGLWLVAAQAMGRMVGRCQRRYLYPL